MKLKLQKKAKKQANYLRNKCVKTLAGLDLLINEAEALIIDSQYLNKNKNYLSAVKFYEDKYAKDIKFRNNCLETSMQVVETQLEIVVKYLLAELPLFFQQCQYFR